ncbi:MAG: N-glycosylase/DNA lyase [Spirochaetaceae bacterium]|nr:N-glycosylase/DNA lyase [Spirochaetaceae bacterium]
MQKNKDQPELATKLRKTYAEIAPAIAARLAEFSALWKQGSDLEIFRELCFCTCTPQTKAHKGWAGAQALFGKNLLAAGNAQTIAETLRDCGVRFHNNKAAYIVKNRQNFYPGTKQKISAILNLEDPQSALCGAVAGWGMKEAAHFLRNIGSGDIACILDRHILRQLARCQVIANIPKTLSKTVYREIDAKMKAFAETCRIPLAALDLVFWYEETGEIFK